MIGPNAPKSVFIYYAHKDNESSDASNRWLDRVREHLRPLVQQECITVCSDQDIDLGDDWHAHVQKQLQGARVAVLLASPAFLASDYIRNSELPVLLRNAKEQGVKIIPIVLRPCLFAETRFRYPDPKIGPQEFTLASLQAGGSPSRALSEMAEGEQDRVLLKVAQAVAKFVGNLPTEEEQEPRPRFVLEKADVWPIPLTALADWDTRRTSRSAARLLGRIGSGGTHASDMPKWRGF